MRVPGSALMEDIDTGNQGIHDLCGSCGLNINCDEPDPCIGEWIPGVNSICCGHGHTRRTMKRNGTTYSFTPTRPYVRFDNGLLLEGQEATDYLGSRITSVPCWQFDPTSD